MNKEKMNKYIKAILLSLCVFLTGFMGSILIVMKRESEMGAKIATINGEMSEYIEFFGIKIGGFVSTMEDGRYIVDIYRHSFINYLPFLSGFALLLVVLVLAFLCKKIVSKKMK